MKTFNLPDLGEGLPEAEIVTWHVKEGDTVKVDQPMLSVETAKAVVEVPAPYSGKVTRLYAAEGDIVATGKPLVDIDTGGGSGAPSGEADATRETAADAREPSESEAETAQEKRAGADSGTVVGSMPTSDDVLVEKAVAGGRGRRGKGKVKAAPAVRALAKRLGVDLKQVRGTGKGGRVTAADVNAFHGAAAATPQRVKLPPGTPEPLRGPRRAMAQSMSLSRSEVCPCTIHDDADIHGWLPGQDITTRILRALVAGCLAEPGLNGFYDGVAMHRQLEERVDVAIAVDTQDGLIVPVIRHAEQKSAEQIREDLNAMKARTRERRVTPDEMKNFTITLSNFGMMAGRYATPVVVPPTIAILGTGGIQHDVVPVLGGIEVHRRVPLSLTFDHRCVTGGEACRFLAAVIADLAKPG
jgi:2-oxoisovalerate dehydrogenase E2 component (dihydrolipoyl transacylase)